VRPVPRMPIASRGLFACDRSHEHPFERLLPKVQSVEALIAVLGVDGVPLRGVCRQLLCRLNVIAAVPAMLIVERLGHMKSVECLALGP